MKTASLPRYLATNMLALLVIVPLCHGKTHIEYRTANVYDLEFGYRSLVGRHELDSLYHYLTFILHDLFAFLTFIGFIAIPLINNKHHRKFGHIVSLFSILSAATGFVLIAFRYFDVSDELLHIASNHIVINCVFPQFSCFIATFINAFLFKHLYKYIKLLLVTSFIINLNGIYYIIKLLTDQETDIYLKEVSFELLIILQMPILAIDLINFYLIVSRKFQREHNIASHHKLNVIFLCIIMFSGITFNIAHDCYYIFEYPGIQSVEIRILIQVIPISILLWYNFKFIKLYVFSGKQTRIIDCNHQITTTDHVVQSNHL